jgi:hypothetical protein
MDYPGKYSVDGNVTMLVYCFVLIVTWASTWLAKGTLEEYSRKSGSLPHDVIKQRKPTAVQQFPWR